MCAAEPEIVPTATDIRLRVTHAFPSRPPCMLMLIYRSVSQESLQLVLVREVDALGAANERQAEDLRQQRHVARGSSLLLDNLLRGLLRDLLGGLLGGRLLAREHLNRRRQDGRAANRG